jgi:hypothetical protein
MFCPDCGKYLKEIKVNPPPLPLSPIDTQDRSFVPIKVSPEGAYIEKLWPVYMTSEIKISAGYRFPSAEEWVRRRKQVYNLYRNKFAPDNLSDLKTVQHDFGSWLLFSNNLSWTTLQRTATYGLEHPENLTKLLLCLQDENIVIASRVRNTLQGTYKVKGIGQGIVTALLHTFDNNKYGVWNSRTIDTLKKLNQPTFSSDDLGETYKRVNLTLNRIATELNTDLTKLDGFMWFVSKNYEFF